MSEPKDRESVALEDLVHSEMIQTEAITRLLVKKGIITKKELLTEVKTVNTEQHGKVGLS